MNDRVNVELNCLQISTRHWVNRVLKLRFRKSLAISRHNLTRACYLTCLKRKAVNNLIQQNINKIKYTFY